MGSAAVGRPRCFGTVSSASSKKQLIMWQFESLTNRTISESSPWNQPTGRKIQQHVFKFCRAKRREEKKDNSLNWSKIRYFENNIRSAWKYFIGVAAPEFGVLVITAAWERKNSSARRRTRLTVIIGLTTWFYLDKIMLSQSQNLEFKVVIVISILKSHVA